MNKVPIFRIGTAGAHQCAKRVSDEVWFERRRLMGRYHGWSRWVKTLGGRRPDHAWYDPTAGMARLPKDE
jgi:hypothetical protein